MKRRLTLPFALLACCLAAGSVCGADDVETPGASNTEEAVYVMYSGEDTLMLERFTRTDTSVAGVMVVGRRLMQGYTMTIGPQASVKAVDLRLRPYPQMPDSAQMYVHAHRRGRDVRIYHRDQERRIDKKHNMDKNVQFGVSGSISFIEQIVRRSRALGGDTKIPIYLPGKSQKWVAEVTPIGADSARVMLSAEEWRFKVDPDGRLLGGETLYSKIKMRRMVLRGDQR